MAKKQMVSGIMCIFLLGLGRLVWAQEPADEGATLDDVIVVVRDALKEAQQNNVPGFPALKDVTVTLQTLINKGAGVQFKFLVFTIGTKYESENASTIKFIMKPPATVSAGPKVSAMTPETLKQALARAINLAKANFLHVPPGTPALVMNNIEIEVKFAVKVSGSGTGGAKVELLPIGIEGTANLARTKVHIVKLTFG